jgi:hypothetical protein
MNNARKSIVTGSIAAEMKEQREKLAAATAACDDYGMGYHRGTLDALQQAYDLIKDRK